MKSLLSLSLLIISSLFSSHAFAESSQKIIIEMIDNNGYTLITNKGTRNQNVPADYLSQLNVLLKRKVIIEDVGFSPDGGWTILTKSRNYTKNIAGGYVDAINKLQKKGIKVNSVAFDPKSWDSKHGFAIIYDTGYTADNIPSSLKIKLDESLNNKAKLGSVEFTPLGGWSMLTNIDTWGSIQESPSTKFSYLDNLRKLYIERHHVFSSAFNPTDYAKKSGWIAIEDDAFTGQFIPESLQKNLIALGIHSGTSHEHEKEKH